MGAVNVLQRYTGDLVGLANYYSHISGNTFCVWDSNNVIVA